MRIRVRTVLIALATTAMTALISAGSATAGGPTSVIIVNPSTGVANALYYDDADYRILHDALAPATGISVERPPELDSGTGHSAINITWLIHDVEVWRIDEVRVDLKYVWVKTTTITGPAPYEADSQWHVAARSDEVIGVLDRLGVLSGELKASGGWHVTEPSAEAAGPAGPDDAAAAPDVQQRTNSAAPAVPAWSWLVAATAIGVAVGVLARPAVTAYLRARPERAPRQQLLELPGFAGSGQPDSNPAKATPLVLDLGDLDPADLPR